MLGQHVQPALARRVAVELAGLDRLDGRTALHEFEAVARHQDRLARLVVAVVGPAEPLQQPAGALGRAHLDDEVDIAPVDAEIERRGADHGAQGAARHGGLDLAALFALQRPVMQGDGQPVLVHAPQLAEHDLRLAARVDEDQRGAMRPDLCVNRRQGVQRHVAGPGDARFGFDDRDVRRRRRAALGRSARRLQPPSAASQRRAATSSCTVADRPIRRAAGASVARRAMASASRSPRLLGMIACSSSRIRQRSRPNRRGASA